MTYKTMKDLTTLRTEIDELDWQIAHLLNKRMELTDAVGVIKKEQELDFEDKGREKEVIERVKNEITHPILSEGIEEIYQQLIEIVKINHILVKKKQPLPFKRMGVIGLGIIGGSMVRGLKAVDPNVEIFTTSRKSRSTALAQEQGYIDGTYDTIQDLTRNVELIILACPIGNVLEIAREIAATTGLKKKVIVIDVASIKKEIGREFESLTTEQVEFLPTHPMAGSDQEGFAHSKGTMFVRQPWVVCPHSKSKDETVQKIKKLISTLGPRIMDVPADDHDSYIASSSHLVFLLSTYIFAFMHENKYKAMMLSGTGFEKITRLASGNPLMHAQIYNGNYKNTVREREEFIQFLKENEVTENKSEDFFERYKQLRDKFIASKG